MPNIFEFSEPIANLFAARSVRRAYSIDSDGLVIAWHSDMSIRRFYERAWNIVNEIRYLRTSKNLKRFNSTSAEQTQPQITLVKTLSPLYEE